MAELSTGRRSRGGGGAARRAERTSIKIETAKYIERNIPNFDLLSEEALEIIEANAELMLEEVGVNFVNNPAALERWRAGRERRRRAGADPAWFGKKSLRNGSKTVHPTCSKF